MQAVLSHYRLLEQVGAGGMGVVYRAHDERLDRDVALKVLPAGTIVDPSARKRFRQEALTLSKLNHPNIATVHDFDTSEDGTDFLVEEFIEGQSLDAILLPGPLPEKRIIHLALQLAEGLAAAHEHDVIHRDLKPANVRVTPDERLKILDFGLAIVLRAEPSSDALTQSLTAVRTAGGTLPYMAPEQLAEGALDARTDIWAAGCLMYEMATGHRPFSGSGPMLIDAILHRPPSPIAQLNPWISAPLCAAIAKCLDKEPTRRYHSAREISVDLQRAASKPLPIEVPPSAARRGAVPAVVAAAIVLALVGYLIESNVFHRPLGKQGPEAATQLQVAPHESYLAGLKYLDRWDKAGNLESAIRSFDQAVKTDPEFALGYSALGEAYWAKYRLGHDSRWIDKAEQSCRRAAELNDQLPAVYVTLARVHNGKEQHDLALQEIQQALKLEPNNPEAILGEAAVYAGMGREDKAEEAFKKSVTLNPQGWDGYYELGAFYYRHRRYADAAAEFARVLEITPDNAMAHATLGGALQLLKQDAEAEKHLKRSVELQPSYAAYTNLGALYYRERRWAESSAMTRKALDIDSKGWRAWANLGLALLWLNQTDGAKEAFHNELIRLQEIAKINLDDAEVQVELGLLYSRDHLRDKAVPCLEAALARSPQDPAILSNAAEAYENLGNRDRAIQLDTQALALGWTLAQLENDPGQQKLLLDPRFKEIVQQAKFNPSPVRRTP